MGWRLVFAALLVAFATRAAAADYSDIWYDPDENGWGVNVIQNDTTQFITFFIYGVDGSPTWLVAATADDGNGNYTGGLVATTGTYYGVPWAGAAGSVVGTASFTPIDGYHATLTYTLGNGPTVTRTIVRQTLAGLALAGSYSGSISGKVTGCTDANQNKANVKARYNLTVTQPGDGTATLVFTFVDNTYSGMVCTLSGSLTQYGRIDQIAGATYGCTGGGFSAGATTAAVESFHPSGQGIEGRWTAATGGGCNESIHFAAVL
jgi:hypothetical protein